MPPRIRPPNASLRALLALVTLLIGALPAAGQGRDGRIPAHGRLWLEVLPILENWSEQFALDSPDPNLVDGDREPLYRDYDGSIASRLFPGPAPFVADLNQDAAALGFNPVSEGALSFGALDFSDLTRQKRSLALGFELGLLDRLAIGARAPLVLTDVETSFRYDSAGASVTFGPASFAGSTFLPDARAAVTELESLIDGGTLMGPELEQATALRDATNAFLDALAARISGGGLIPTAPSGAGMQMLARFGEFAAGFESFGLALPELGLPETGSILDLPLLFEEPPVAGTIPGRSRQGLLLGEYEISARISILDGITRRESPSDSAGVRPPPDDSAAADSAVVLDSAGVARGAAGRPRLLRLRTTVGALVRIPSGSPGIPPFNNPTDFVDLPIGDGQMDVELSLFQDIALARWLEVRSVATYGIQLADELRLRVHPPDRPYAFASTQTVVRRDLGDYLSLLVRPSVRLGSAVWIGVEYDYWKLEDASYALIEPLPDVPDASPLAVESGGSRHSFGLGFAFDMSEARSREQMAAGTTPVRAPWRFQASIRRSVSGSGGQIPALFRFAAYFRVPIRVF